MSAGGLMIEVGGQSVGITPAERGRLERGEVLVTPLPPEGGEGVSARALALVDASPESVWPVVRDAELFSEFMPRTKSSRLVEQRADGLVYTLEIDMPFPMKNLVSQVLSVASEEDDRRARRWSLLEGSYKRNNGEWVVLPWDDGRRTLLGYWLDAAPKVLMPNALVRKAQTSSLPEVIECVRRRARATAS